MAQVAADTLGVDYRHCRVIHGQTDRIAFGIGAHASRATVMTASATHIAALNVRDKALDMAAELLQTTPDALDIVDGEVVRSDGSARPLDQPRRDRATSRARRRQDARRPRAGACRRGLVQDRASGLSLWQPRRGGARRPRDRRRHGRALFHRLRHRPRHQSGAGRRPDRRRLRARARRRAARGVHLQRARRSARRHLRRLSACRRCTRRRRRRCCCARITPRRSIRSASRAPAKAASPAVGAAIASAIDDAIGMPGAVTRTAGHAAAAEAILARGGNADSGSISPA